MSKILDELLERELLEERVCGTLVPSDLSQSCRSGSDLSSFLDTRGPKLSSLIDTSIPAELLAVLAQIIYFLSFLMHAVLLRADVFLLAMIIIWG